MVCPWMNTGKNHPLCKLGRRFNFFKYFSTHHQRSSNPFISMIIAMGSKGRSYCRCLYMCDSNSVLVFNFLCLLINMFLLVMQMQKYPWPAESYFQPVMVPADSRQQIATLAVFSRALDAANITYSLTAGTLLGAYRHHGPIPWDDDVDILINGSQKALVRDTLRRLRPTYDLVMYREGDLEYKFQWKFYQDTDASRTYVHHKFRWPYIDMFFFQENATHIWDERMIEGDCWSKELFFPLVRRPFGILRLPTPCNTKDVLYSKFDVDMCRSRRYSHMMEVPMLTFSVRDVPCTQLHRAFPFVHRMYTDGLVNESLMIGDWTMQTVTLPTHCKNPQVQGVTPKG